MTPTEILEALNGPANTYQREAVQAAMDRPDEVVPLLLEHLEEVLREPERFELTVFDSDLSSYAIFLLGYHRTREAHRLLVRLSSLPGDMPFDLVDDTVHRGLPGALWKTSGGDVGDIKRIILNREANEFCRASAIRALLYGVAERVVSRETVVEFLQGLFTGEEASRNEYMFWNAVASALSRLWPGESMDVLRKAFDERLIDPFFIDMEQIEAALAQGKDARLAAFEQNALKLLAETPHEVMARWATFDMAQSEEEGGVPDKPLAEPLHKRSQRNTEVKRKRKQARAARKKGRRKRR